MSEPVSLVEIPEAFLPLLEPAQYKVYYGGRGGAKSWQFARILATRTHTARLRVLCGREFQTSIADSVHQVLTGQIQAIGLGQWYNVTQRSIVSRLTGSEYIFKGLHHNAQEIKSTEDIDVCWVEEAEAVTHDSWEALLPTIFRNAGSELWISFNPLEETASTYQRFVVNPPPGALVKKVSWRDNPWFPENMEKLRRHMERTDPDAYQNVWEGFPRRLSEATIFRGRFVVEAFETPPLTQIGRYYLGGDWGFANDPTALVRCFIKDDVLFIDQEAYAVGVELDDLPAFFGGGTGKTGIVYQGVPGAREWPIKADASRPETISYVSRQGFNIDAAAKWQGSVEDGIEHLKGFKQIVIHPRCRWTAEEFRLYSYKTDQKTTPPTVLPVIVDAHNHAIDALRYALDGFIQGRGAAQIWARL